MSFTILSIIIISLLGTLSHFLYDISNHNKYIGLFVAVNESTWEHIKIALTPTLFWGIIDGLLYGVLPNFFFAKFISLFIIIILIPVLFYGYQVILGKNYYIIDILIFYVTIVISQFMFIFFVKIHFCIFIIQYLSCIGIFIIFGGYMIHTLLPGKSFIFKDPLSNKYGFKGHK